MNLPLFEQLRAEVCAHDGTVCSLGRNWLKQVIAEIDQYVAKAELLHKWAAKANDQKKDDPGPDPALTKLMQQVQEMDDRLKRLEQYGMPVCTM